jgi:hypothetical protein
LAQRLIEGGDQVIALGDLSTGRMDNITHLIGRRGFEYRIGSVSDVPLAAEPWWIAATSRFIWPPRSASA